MRFLFVFILLVSTNLVSAQINFNEYHWSKINLPESNPSTNFICDMKEDKNRNIWVTTSGQGLFKYNGNKWENIRIPNPLISGWLAKIILHNDSLIYFIGVPGYLISFNQKSNHWDSIILPSKNQLNCYIKDQFGNYIFGTGISDSVIYLFRNNTFEIIATKVADAMCMLFTKKNELLISTRAKGLLIFKYSEKKKTYIATNKLSDELFYDLVYSGQNQLLGSSFSSLSIKRFEVDSWRTIVKHPIELEYNFNGINKYCPHKLIRGKKGEAIFGTQFNPAIACVMNNDSITCKLLPVKSSVGVSSLLAHSDGSYWVGTWANGIYVLSKDEKKYKKNVQQLRSIPAQE